MSSHNNGNSATIVFFVIVVIVILGFFGLVLAGKGTTAAAGSSDTVSQTTDGKQVILVTVTNSGYSPRTITAKGGVPTIVRMNSNNALGCERSFRFPRLGITKTLPTSGATDIDINTPAIGSSLNGTCSMGMYNFTINFT